MNINLYYGGRGLIEDPSLYVINKLTEVLEEVRVNVTRYNLYEQKNGIAMLPNTLKEADGVILVVSMEWFGIGGFMQQFLDACWLYGDRKKLKNLYMFPVVVSTVAGERDAEYTLIRAWELLGGRAMTGICTYVDSQIDFETDGEIQGLIEKRGEDIYRVIHQKTPAFKSSACAASGELGRVMPAASLTPQESEQLSIYVSNDTFVAKQKEDVEQLSKLYRNILDTGREESKQEFIKEFKDSFVKPEEGFEAVYSIEMTDMEKTLVLEVKDGALKAYYGTAAVADVSARTTRDVVNKLVSGRQTMQGAFMSGALSSKGDFKLLRSFDQLFMFH